MKDRIDEAYKSMLNEQTHPDDPSGEREGFVKMVINRAHILMGYGVMNRSEVKKITQAIEKIVGF
jgi:hypothetical protein